MFEDHAEQAIIVGVKLNNDPDFESSLQELHGLVKAAGGDVVMTVVQSRQRPETACYIGRGKLTELSQVLKEIEADMVVFDSELSPVQIRNLEERLNVKILDRTMLILDIFAQRARSKEGKLQVELARLEYHLPRLTGRGKDMSRQGGGIGTRGAGEQKLELDRRHIRRRIQEIKKQMKKLEKTRELHRKQRERAGFKLISLVGYTNAGKSSLFNSLCINSHRHGREEVEADDRLFQTLDTTIRKIKIAANTEVLITDTVGFIQKLPHHLVAAFRSTLEETMASDILIHVVDVSDPTYIEKIRIVEKVLQELGADQDRIMTVFNKADLLTKECHFENKILLSAKTGKGIDVLFKELHKRLL